MKVPFIDLKKQYLSIQPSLDKAWTEVVNESAFIKGKYVSDFENAFAKALGIKHCIGVANGTDAIYIALKMLGVGSGDEVITSANSWISSSETITQTGARVVFADEEPEYFCMDPAQIEKNISSKTKAIIAVHIYGQSAPLEAIRKICDRHKLFLIEDCAQSHFTQYGGRNVGTFGKVATFSFYPGKNLGAYGDAGAIVTNDDQLAEKMRMYANHGALIKHQHKMEGINSRLDGLQAAILSAKLPHIYDWNEKRRAHARAYNILLRGIKEITLPAERADSKHTYHLYVIRAQKRDALQQYLKAQGIETQIHYPTALPLLPAYHYLGKSQRDFPVASSYSKEILSLPLYPEMSDAELEYVSTHIRKFYS